MGDQHVSFKDSVLIGLAQVLALFPGVSRSGMTTSMALKNKVELDRALDFSFMLYIPISFGSLIFTFYDFAKNDFTIASGAYPLYYGLAFIFSFFATLVAFRYIFNMFKSGKLAHFAVYCFVLGTFGILLFLI
jgi:undecaprenyl-diphosphatase